MIVRHVCDVTMLKQYSTVSTAQKSKHWKLTLWRHMRSDLFGDYRRAFSTKTLFKFHITFKS